MLLHQVSLFQQAAELKQLAMHVCRGVVLDWCLPSQCWKLGLFFSPLSAEGIVTDCDYSSSVCHTDRQNKKAV